MKKITSFMPLIFCVLPLSVNAASVLVQTPGPLPYSETRPTGGNLGSLAQVVVGGADREILGIGVIGQSSASLTMRFAVFEDINSSPPIFVSDPLNVAPSAGPMWFDSPAFSFTLSANTTYWIGPVIDGPDDSFRQMFNFTTGATVSQNGLTLPYLGGIGGTGNNQNVRGTVSNPLLNRNNGTVQIGVRIMGIPEPSSSILVIFGLCALASRRTRQG